MQLARTTVVVQAYKSHRYTAGSRTAPAPRRWRVPCLPARKTYRPDAPRYQRSKSFDLAGNRRRARLIGDQRPLESQRQARSGAARSTCHISVLPGPLAESGGCTCTESFSEVKRNFTSRRGSSGATNQTSPVLRRAVRIPGSVSGVPQTFSSARRVKPPDLHCSTMNRCRRSKPRSSSCIDVA